MQINTIYNPKQIKDLEKGTKVFLRIMINSRNNPQEIRIRKLEEEKTIQILERNGAKFLIKKL